MRKIIRKFIESIYPEIASGYYLPKKGTIIGIPDPPTSDEVATDQYRQYYAVNVQLLKPDGTPENAPEMKSMPLPGNLVRDMGGLLAFPNPGTTHDNDMAMCDLVSAVTVTTASGTSSPPNNTAAIIAHKATIQANKLLIEPQKALNAAFTI